MQRTNVRRVIDRRVAPLARSDVRAALARPAGGWVRAVRDALGMSSGDLADRLGVTATAVQKLEASERGGRARLDTLARAADALGCDLVYAFVPRSSLKDIVQRQAHLAADRLLHPVRTTMALEDQAVSPHADGEAVDDLAREGVDRRDLWRVRA